MQIECAVFENNLLSMCEIVRKYPFILFYKDGQLVARGEDTYGYLSEALKLFRSAEGDNQWEDLEKLFFLRDDIRENKNHRLGLDGLIFGQRLTEQRFMEIERKVENSYTDPMWFL